jgi:hypothetical protein
LEIRLGLLANCRKGPINPIPKVSIPEAIMNKRNRYKSWLLLAGKTYKNFNSCCFMIPGIRIRGFFLTKRIYWQTRMF